MENRMKAIGMVLMLIGLVVVVIGGFLMVTDSVAWGIVALALGGVMAGIGYYARKRKEA